MGPMAGMPAPEFIDNGNGGWDIRKPQMPDENRWAGMEMPEGKPMPVGMGGMQGMPGMQGGMGMNPAMGMQNNRGNSQQTQEARGLQARGMEDMDQNLS